MAEKSGFFGQGGGFGAGTVNSIGGAVGDLFAAKGYKYKAQGDRLEQQNYLRAAGLADQNEKFTELSTTIKQTQLDRQIYGSMGGTEADVASAGFANSGSSIDILRDSASQGALTKAVTGEQGLITEAGYKEQADSFRTMADAAGIAAHASDTAAKGAMWAAGFHAVAAFASLA